jgi:nucleoside-diphosphate-sugar epimerase
MNVLLTGGTGFIGSFVASRLNSHPQVKLVTIGQDQLSSIRLGKTPSLLQTFGASQSFDAVVNIAGHIGNSPHQILEANFHGIHDILDLCNNTGVGKLIQISRSFMRERAPNSATSSRLDRLYSYSKRYAELVLHEQLSVPAFILRITAPIWSTMPEDRYLSQILKSIKSGVPIKIYGQGHRRQNYIRLDDIALAIENCLFTENPNGIQKILVAGPENFTDFEFAQTVSGRLSMPFNYEFVPHPLGKDVDESDYGVDLMDIFKPLPIKPRPIDDNLLLAHLNDINAI